MKVSVAWCVGLVSLLLLAVPVLSQGAGKTLVLTAAAPVSEDEHSQVFNAVPLTISDGIVSGFGTVSMARQRAGGTYDGFGMLNVRGTYSDEGDVQGVYVFQYDFEDNDEPGFVDCYERVTVTYTGRLTGKVLPTDKTSFLDFNGRVVSRYYGSDCKPWTPGNEAGWGESYIVTVENLVVKNGVFVTIPASAAGDVAKALTAKEKAVKGTPRIPEPSGQDEEQPEGYLSKAWNWVTWGAGKTKDVYEGAGDEAPAGTAGLDIAGKITEGVKDAGEVSEAFDGVNKKIKSGQITDKKGKLLKVGYGLGKGIKWIAKNVPIVGDAVGDAADGSFQASMKFGETLAEHSTKTDKCIEEPLSDECID